VRGGQVRIHPKELEPRYFAWVDDMHDWCISRQLWWGHRIPVWYGPAGETVCVGPEEQPPSGEGWTQDPDVLDTWFSSGLWPFSTLGWPAETPELDRFYPTSVLLTGYDILFFWVARMMMFGLYAMDGQPPFRTAALTGLVRDEFGRKMSKSKGNAVDPLLWMDRYGSDALRFTLARGANPGTDVPISEEWVQGGGRFCNKLWNATRLALQNGAHVGELPGPEQLSVADRWILTRLHETLVTVDGWYADYQFARLTDALYHFAWDEFCDWYLELAKVQLAAGGDQAESTRLVLGHVLDVVLKLLQPIVPFVTEVLWTALTGEESVVVAPWPTVSNPVSDPPAVAEIAGLQRLVTEVRRFRSEQRVNPGQRVPARISGLGALIAHEDAMRTLLRLTAPGAEFTPTARLTLGETTIELDLSGSIDVAAERKRLEKDLAAAETERSRALAKLGNEAFLGKAPEAVVAKVRGQLATAEADVERIEAALAALPDNTPPSP